MIHIRGFIKIIILSFLIVAFQTIIIDNLNLSIYTYLPVYVIMPIILPKILRIDVMLLLSFFFGSILDYFSASGGSITISLLVITLLRNLIVRNFIVYEQFFSYQSLTLRTVRPLSYLKYIFLITLLFNIVLVLVENFGQVSLMFMILKISISTLLTIPLIFLLQYLVYDDFD